VTGSINGNAYKLCFWILAYALHDENLLASIRNEIDPVVNEGLTGLEYRLEHCARLDSIYNEVLRLTASSSSIRTVLSTTEIGGKQLRSGTKVLIPYRQLHFNEDIWGNDAKTFDPERFLKNKDLARNSSFRPFGGGTTYCPGRFLAKREVMTFVALLLYRFDIALATHPALPASKDKATKPAFPRLEEQKPCLGIMGPAKGHDVCLKVRPTKR
jgi:cytochrome P450